MWVPDRMIGFYLAAHITTSLNYSHSYSAIAIPHIEQSRFTTIHTESISSSLHPQLLTPRTLTATVGTHSLHSQLHSATLTATVFSLLHTTIHSCTDSLTLTICTWLHNYLTDTDWIQLGWFTDIVSKRSERTRRKHRLRGLFYCRVTYTS
jgi:hypothetical protein